MRLSFSPAVKSACISIIIAAWTALLPALASAELLRVCNEPGDTPSGTVCTATTKIFPSTASIAPPGTTYSDTAPATLDLAEWAKEYYHGAVAMMLPGSTIVRWIPLGEGVWVPEWAYAPGVRVVYYPIQFPNADVDWCGSHIPAPCIDSRYVAQWSVYLQSVRRAREMAGNTVSAEDQTKEMMSLRGVLAYDQSQSSYGSPGKVPGGTTFGYTNMLLADLYRQLPNNPRIKTTMEEYLRWENAMMGTDGNFSYWYNIRADEIPDNGWDGIGGYFGVDMIRVAWQAYWGAPLSDWYSLTGNATALDLGKKASRYLLHYENDRFWDNPDPSRFFADPPVVFVGQTLGHPPAAAALLADARARLRINPQDPVSREEVSKAKDVYEFMKRRANMGLIGNFGNPSALGVMLQLAVELEGMRRIYPDLIPFGTYYEDAERWTRNQAAESRITAAFAEKYIPNGPSGNAYNDRIASRAIGTFLSDATHSITRPFNTLMDNNDGLWLMRGLYQVWKNTVEIETRGTQTMALVNILLNNASKYMDVYSDIPYRGRVVVDMRNDIGSINTLALRIPTWAGNSVTITEDTGSGPQALAQGARWSWTAPYVAINQIKPGAVYTVRFPMKVQHLRITQRHSQDQWWSESPYGGNGFPETLSYYNGTFLGDTLVDADNRPTGGIPQYQRQDLLALINGDTVNEIAPPQKSLTRFVFAGSELPIPPPPPPPPPPPDPSVTLKVNDQDTLVANGAYTLSWNSTSVTGPKCKIFYASAAGSGDFEVDANASGAATTGLIGTFTMKCESSQGQLSKTVTITSAAPPPPPPPPSLVALLANGTTTLSLTQAQTYTLTYSSTGVQGPTCTISYAAASGATGSYPVDANVSGSGQSGLIGTHTMTCIKDGQSISKTISISLQALPPPPPGDVPQIAFSVANSQSSITLPLDAYFTLTYSTANATACTMSRSVNGGTPTVSAFPHNTSGTSIDTVPQGGIVYALACSNASGSTTKTVRIMVAEAATTFLPLTSDQSQLANALSALGSALKAVLQLLQ